MKAKFPIIGEVRTGDDVKQVKSEKKTVAYVGSFLDIFKGKGLLSDEENVSSKLIGAFNEWVYANVSVLAEEVSKMEIRLYKNRLADGKVELVEVDEHPLLDVLDRFNGFTTRSDGFYVTEAHLDLTGDAFWSIENRGKPNATIFVLQPDKMKLVYKNKPDEGGKVVDHYIYKAKNKEGAEKEVKYEVDEIIHIKVPNPQNPYRGKSTVEAAAKSIDIDTFASEGLVKFFENGMVANFMLSTDKGLNETQVKSLQTQLRASRTGLRNFFKIPVLSRGLKPVPIQQSNKESQLLEIEEWMRDKIMVMFKNTKASLGIVEDVNRANAEATLSEWRRSVIKPKMQRIVDAINEYLVPEYADNLIVGFDDPVPEDRLAKIKEATELYSNAGKPVITLNEARDLIDFDAVAEEGADEVKQPMPTFEQPVDNLNDEKNLPPAIRNVNHISHFRRNKWYSKLAEEKQVWADVRKAAEKIVKSKKVKVEPKKPPQRRVDNFWKRVSDIIEEYEQQFRSKAEQFIGTIVDEATTKLDAPEAREANELFDREQKLLEAQAQFAPILTQALALAGQEANKLLGIKDPYIPKAAPQATMEDQIKEQIKLFAGSMLDTDQDVMASILADGLREGAGIPTIRRAIEDKFKDFTRSQAERVTRTEVAWAANRGIVDSYKQSGVVVAKQWLTAPDACPECEPMNGKIVGLEETYIDQGGETATGRSVDYRDIEEPPLHPNCRCTTISVIEGLDPLIEPKSMEDMKHLGDKIKLQAQIVELESQIDKRTKAYRKLKTKKLQTDEYVKELEALVDE